MPGVNDWLAKASSDLKSLKKLIKDDDDTLDSAAYFTQQTAEKALKSYLVFKKQSVPRAHDLEKLLEHCMKYDRLFDRLLEDALALSSYATYARYPDDRFCIDRQEAGQAIVRAAEILTFVKRTIEDLSHPNMKIF